MKLSEEQLKFLHDELGIKPEDIAEISADDWRKIREQCFDIEVSEVVDSDNGEGEISDRGAIAADIASIKYSMLTAD